MKRDDIKCPWCHTRIAVPETHQDKVTKSCPKCGTECNQVVEHTSKLPAFFLGKGDLAYEYEVYRFQEQQT